MKIDALHDVHSDPDTSRTPAVSSTSASAPVGVFSADQDTLRRISWLIELGTSVINGLIGLRLLLKLMAANPDNRLPSLSTF